jgi:hypothetical protein
VNGAAQMPASPNRETVRIVISLLTGALRPEQDYRRPVPVLLVYGQRDHLGHIAMSTRAWTHPFAGRGCGA